MIVREGQVYRHIKNINESDKIDDLRQINYDLDFEVVKTDNERVVIKHLTHKVEKFCDLKTFNDSFIYITTPSKEDKPKNKYHRDLKGVTVDVYDVLKAFEVTDPALQHLIKKALCAGLRGHKNKDQDLQDILDSAKRAVELNK